MRWLSPLLLLLLVSLCAAGGLSVPGGGGGGSGSAAELTYASDACVTAANTQDAVEQAAQRLCTGTRAARDTYFPAPLAGHEWYVIDGASATDCVTGGGTTPVHCIYDGTQWTYDVATITVDTITSISEIDATVRNASSNTNLLTRDLAQAVATQQVTADTNTLSCGTTLYPDFTLLVSTNTGAINLVSNPQVADGTSNQTCTICGTSDTNYPILETGNGLSLRAAANMQNLFCLRLQYVLAEDLWRERWRTPTASFGGTDTQVLFVDTATPSGDAGLTFNKTSNVLTASGGFVSSCDVATQECGIIGIGVETSDASDTTDAATANVVLRSTTGVLQSRVGNGSIKDYLTVPTVRAFYIPAGAMSITGTCTDTTPQLETLLTSGPQLWTIEPADGDTCSIEFDFVMPDAWNAGTLTVELVAQSNANNTTEVLELDFAGQCVRDNDPVAAHSTTGEQPATCTFGAQAEDEQHCTTAAITLNGTCAAGAHVYMRGQVDATATTLNPITDGRILGVKIEYTITSTTD